MKRTNKISVLKNILVVNQSVSSEPVLHQPKFRSESSLAPRERLPRFQNRPGGATKTDSTENSVPRPVAQQSTEISEPALWRS